MIPDYDDDVGTGFEELLDDCGWDGEHCIDEGSEACNTCPLFALLHGSDPDSIDTTDYDPDEPTFEEKMSHCGMMPDGICSYAGSEYCDWHCPFDE